FFFFFFFLHRRCPFIGAFFIPPPSGEGNGICLVSPTKEAIRSPFALLSLVLAGFFFFFLGSSEESMGGRRVLCTVAPLMALVVLSRGLVPLLCAPAVVDAGDEGRSAPFFCVCVSVLVLLLFSLPALPSAFWSVTPRRMAHAK
ncbi:hypothetical protein Tc00.1047053506895.5, partial [Trypanosoma cruzi]